MAKQSLASAYVQIIPSADGISGKLAEVMGGEAASAGKISGKSLGLALVRTLTKVVAAAGIGKMLQSAFTGGTAFESAMAKVGTIADTAKVPLESLSSQVLQVSGDMHIGANEIAEAAYQAISAGQDTGNAVAFAGQASMLATAGFTSTTSAVDILTTALNAYSKGADEAGHVSDVLLTTQNLGKTSVDELAGSMGRVIPLAAAYNVSLENLSSGLAIMTANGIATAEASTYIKSMLNELGDTGSDVGEILQQKTGQSFAELNADGKSLGDVLQVLYDSVGGDATKFAGLWSSVEAGTGALSLASSGADKFNGVLQQMQADSGATQTAYDTMTDTMAYKLDGLKANAQNLGTALFDAVSGRLGEAVALAGGYLQTLSESVQQNGIAGLAEGLAAVFADLTTNVPRRGNWGATIAPGESVTVPDGKHDGGGRVSAKALKMVTMNVASWPHEYPAMEWHYTLTGGTLVGIASLDGASGDGSSNTVDSIRIVGNTIYVANQQGGIPNRNITLLYY